MILLLMIMMMRVLILVMIKQKLAKQKQALLMHMAYEDMNADYFVDTFIIFTKSVEQKNH